MLRVALCLVKCRGVSRRTRLTAAYFERVSRDVASYFDVQSGSRITMTFDVFDWTELSFGYEEWLAAGFNVGDKALPEVAARYGFDPKAYDGYMFVQDDQVSIGAVYTANGRDTLFAADHFDQNMAVHELSHWLGSPHSNSDSPSGPVEYGARFCVMGSDENSFFEPKLIVDGEGALEAHSQSGPGLCVPQLHLLKWLNLEANAVHVWPTTKGFSSTVELSALRGAPPVTDLSRKVACVIYAEDRYVVEFRSRASHWDQGIKTIAPEDMGAVVVYRSPAEGPLTPLEVAWFPARVGASLKLDDLGVSLPLSKGHLLTVLSADPSGQTIELRIASGQGRKINVWWPTRVQDFRDFRPIVEPPDPQEIEIAGIVGIAERLEQLVTLRKVVGPRYQRDLTSALEQERVRLLQAVEALDLAADQGARQIPHRGTLPTSS